MTNEALQRKVRELEKRIAALEKRFESLEPRIAAGERADMMTRVIGGER